MQQAPLSVGSDFANPLIQKVQTKFKKKINDVTKAWFRGFPVLGSVGERGLYLFVYAFERMLIFCVLAGWRVVEADSIIPPSLSSQAAPLGAAAPLFLLIPPPFPGPRCLDVPLACPTSLSPLHGAASAGPSGNRLCLAGWARVLCGK